MIRKFVLLALLASSAALAKVEVLDVLSSVSYKKSAPVPGGLTTLFVRGLQNIEGTTVVESYPAGTELAGVQVNIYGRSASVLLVSQLDGYQQINVQVSWIADVSVRPMIELRQGEEVTIVEDVPPGIFDAIYTDESGHAVAFHAADWSRITATNPARQGESILFFASNFGKLDRPMEDGSLAPEANTPSASVDSFSDTLGVRLVNPNLVGPEYYWVGTALCDGFLLCRPPLAAGLLGVFFLQVYLDRIDTSANPIPRALIIERRLCSSNRFPCPDLRVRTSQVALLHVAEPE